MGAPLYKHFGDLAGNPGPVVLPVAPCFNIVTGGPHAGNKLAFQEHFIVPMGAETSYLTRLSVCSLRFGIINIMGSFSHFT